MFFFSLSLEADKPNALAEPRGDEEILTKKGKKKKNVSWAEEEQLKEYFYFDLDETERGGSSLLSVGVLVNFQNIQTDSSNKMQILYKLRYQCIIH